MVYICVRLTVRNGWGTEWILLRLRYVRRTAAVLSGCSTERLRYGMKSMSGTELQGLRATCLVISVSYNHIPSRQPVSFNCIV